MLIINTTSVIVKRLTSKDVCLLSLCVHVIINIAVLFFFGKQKDNGEWNEEESRILYGRATIYIAAVVLECEEEKKRKGRGQMG